ncbi:hypothetical protein GCM10010344_36130 [Streptomyces bluensis]|nr:hypothetical protein GCM10010344_36130 [Streptomyces bluensis]
MLIFRDSDDKAGIAHILLDGDDSDEPIETTQALLTSLWCLVIRLLSVRIAVDEFPHAGCNESARLGIRSHRPLLRQLGLIMRKVMRMKCDCLSPLFPPLHQIQASSAFHLVAPRLRHPRVFRFIT